MAAELNALPPFYWGLHPLFWSHVKLCVAQIRALTSFRNVHNSHCLYGHPVSRCVVAGLVVGVVEKASFVRFAVDDGTGVVDCMVWRRNMDGTEKVLDVAKLSHGTPVTVVGRLRVPPVGRMARPREISVARIEQHTDDSQLLVHWLDVAKLTRTVYLKPLRHFIPTVPLVLPGEEDTHAAAAGNTSSISVPREGNTLPKVAATTYVTPAASRSRPSVIPAPSAHTASAVNAGNGDGDGGGGSAAGPAPPTLARAVAHARMEHRPWATSQAGSEQEQVAFMSAVMDVVIKSHPHGDASEAIGFSATQAVDDIEDFDEEAEGESGKRGGWTFRLPAKFTAEDVLACPWLATLLDKSLHCSPSGALATKLTNHALSGLLRHGVVYRVVTGEFCFVSHDLVLGPLIKECVLAYRPDRPMDVAGCPLKDLVQLVHKDRRTATVSYARVMRSVRLLQDEGDIIEVDTDVYALAPELDL